MERETLRPLGSVRPAVHVASRQYGSDIEICYKDRETLRPQYRLKQQS